MDIGYISSRELKMEKLKERIVIAGLTAGFGEIGFARSRVLNQDIEFMADWISKKRYADMNWLARNFERRGTPPEWVRTIIVAVKPYHPLEWNADEKRYSAFADGDDYHAAISAMLSGLLKEINTVGGRAKTCVDTSAIFEKAWAKEAGLGFIGKNKIFVSEKFGPFVLLGLVLTDLELPADERKSNLNCGNCRLCIDRCPTSALDEFGLDVRRCISWMTIEKKSELSEEEKIIVGNRIFGCDECLLACPWSKKSLPSRRPTHLAISKRKPRMNTDKY